MKEQKEKQPDIKELIKQKPFLKDHSESLCPECDRICIATTT
jgi:hypothetical protein